VSDLELLAVWGAVWVLFFAALDFAEQWQRRRRPVRDGDGVWRMPRIRGGR